MLALGFDLMDSLIELFGFAGMRLQSLLCFRCLLLQPGIEFIDMPRQAVDLAGARSGERIRFGIIAFRDRGDAYVTKTFDLTTDVAVLVGVPLLLWAARSAWRCSRRYSSSSASISSRVVRKLTMHARSR